MIPRLLKKELISAAKSFPIIGLTGPRQSGKTTLVKHSFPHLPYVNLESPETWELVSLDPKGFLDKYSEGVILDEVQNFPELFSYLQVYSDANNKPGQYVITGSNQFNLHEKISQSLAGRIALFDLLPLSLEELKSSFSHQPSLNEQILKGGYPRVYQPEIKIELYYSSYVKTYIGDIRLVINIKDLRIFQQFLKLCAGRIGQELNMHSLANELGISSPTIKNWISLLEASFIIILLSPYYENLGKRITKSPKLYFIDVGLACFLLGMQDVTQLERDPIKGHLVENLIVLELYKARLNRGLSPNLYFYRDNNKNEIDVIFKSGSFLIPIEIKSSKAFQRSFLKNLLYFQNLVQERCEKGYLIYTGDLNQKFNQFQLINYFDSAFIVKD